MVAKRETSKEIEDAAIAFVARIDARPEDAPALEAWLAGDPRRRGAYVRARALLDLVGPSPSRKIAGFAAETALPAASGAEREVRRGFGRRAVLGGGVAATALIAAFGLALRPDPETAVYATDVGEIRRLPLHDGSVLVLNTRSKVVTHFAKDVRMLDLVDGEGLFEVAKDGARPFVVRAGTVRVMAVGTAFSVKRDTTGTEVRVTEGAVRLGQADQGDDALDLTAGSFATISASGEIEVQQLSPEELRRHLAWQVGKIALAGETVAEAAREFNRSNAVVMEIDPVIAGEAVAGWFDIQDPMAFAQAVALAFDATVERKADVIRVGREIFLTSSAENS